MTNLNELYRAYKKQCEENITAEKQFRNEKFWAKESTLKCFYITKWKLCVILVYSRCEQTHYTISRVIYNLIKASVNFHLFFHSLCFASILIGFTTFDWNKKHCTKLTLLLCVLDYPLESFSECRFLLGTKEALCCSFHGLMEKQTILHNFSSHWMFVLAVKHFIFIKKINVGFI